MQVFSRWLVIGGCIILQSLRQENEIIYSIDNTLNYDEDSHFGWTFLTSIPLDENELNCGRCVKCGGWVSDKKNQDLFVNLVLVQG